MSQETGRSGLVAGVLLIALGVLFLVFQFLEIRIWDNIWPFIIIVAGLLFFVGMLAAGKPGGPLAIPGSIITTVGLILLFQNTFGYWETWAYAWTLIVASVGIGLSIYGRYSGVDGARRSGGALARVGVILFFIFGAFFELFLGLTGLVRSGGLIWPLLLILLGVYLLLRRMLFPRSRETSLPASPSPDSHPASPGVDEPTHVSNQE